GAAVGELDLYRLDLVTGVVSTISYSDPTDQNTLSAASLAITANGSALVTTNYYASHGSVFEVQLATGIVTKRTDGTALNAQGKIVRNANCSVMYFVGQNGPVVVFDAASNTFIKLADYQYGRFGAVDRTGTLLSTANYFANSVSLDRVSDAKFIHGFSTSGDV